MEGVLTEDEMLADLAAWLADPEPSQEDGWFLPEDIIPYLEAHSGRPWNKEQAYTVCRDKRKKGDMESIKHTGRTYFRRIDGK